jgi:hypothetical protein
MDEMVESVSDECARRLMNDEDYAEFREKREAKLNGTRTYGKLFENKPSEMGKIEVGMGASGTYWTDRDPYEVIRVVSDQTVDIRPLDVKITGGDYLDPEYTLHSNENYPLERVRRTKTGWKTKTGKRIFFGYARYYRDPSF